MQNYLAFFPPTLIIGILRYFLFLLLKWRNEILFLWRRCHNGKNIMVINWQNGLVVWTRFFFWGLGNIKMLYVAIMFIFCQVIMKVEKKVERYWNILRRFGTMKMWFFFCRLWSTSTTTNPTQKNKICGKHYISFNFIFLWWTIA